MTPPPSQETIHAIALRASEATTPEELLGVLEDLLSTCSEIIAAMLAERAADGPNQLPFTTN